MIKKRIEYQADIDIYHLASELIIDGIISGSQLREELIRRFHAYKGKSMNFTHGKHPVYPV